MAYLGPHTLAWTNHCVWEEGRDDDWFRLSHLLPLGAREMGPFPVKIMKLLPGHKSSYFRKGHVGRRKKTNNP